MEPRQVEEFPWTPSKLKLNSSLTPRPVLRKFKSLLSPLNLGNQLKNLRYDHISLASRFNSTGSPRIPSFCRVNHPVPTPIIDRDNRTRNFKLQAAPPRPRRDGLILTLDPKKLLYQGPKIRGSRYQDAEYD